MFQDRIVLSQTILSLTKFIQRKISTIMIPDWYTLNIYSLPNLIVLILVLYLLIFLKNLIMHSYNSLTQVNPKTLSSLGRKGVFFLSLQMWKDPIKLVTADSFNQNNSLFCQILGLINLTKPQKRTSICTENTMFWLVNMRIVC